MINPGICPNCESPLGENSSYCWQCGQSMKPIRLPFLDYSKELVDSLFNFDNKFFYTLRRLIFFPGLVVKEYNEDKKARFVPPLRLYLFLSFFFFIVVSGWISEDVESVRGTINELSRSEVKALRVTLFTDTEIPLELAQNLFETENITEQQIEEFLAKEKISSDPINNKILVRLVRFQRGEISSEQIGQEFLSAASFLVFVLMPLFALILKLFLGFRSVYYSEALVFSLYFHSLVGIVCLLGLGINWLTDSSLVPAISAVVGMGYLVFYIRTAFGRETANAVVISLAAAALYSLVFLAAFLVATLYSIVL